MKAIRENKGNKGKQEWRGRWPEWWEEVPEWERQLIRTVMGMLKGAKRSQAPGVAEAALAWERDFRLFIKGRLICRHRQLIKLRRKCKLLVPAPKEGMLDILKLISSPLIGRNRPDA